MSLQKTKKDLKLIGGKKKSISHNTLSKIQIEWALINQRKVK